MARGARVAWIVAVILGAFGLLAAIGMVLTERPREVDGPLQVAQAASAVASFALLLHPQTRSWCVRKLRLSD